MKKKKIFSKVIVKRMIISLLLGLLFGVICASFASSGTLGEYWGGALMWNLIFNRIIMGFVIALVGLITIHPVFGFKMYPFLRGALAGAFISVDISFGPFISGVENAGYIAFMTIFVGAIYGMIIDIVATKFAGEGLEEFNSIK